METIKVATVIEALNLIGRIYRNEDGSEPADAVTKILQQLDGAAGMTLAEWAEANEKNRKAAAKQQTEAPTGNTFVDEEAVARIERAETQAQLRETIAALVLTAEQWQALAERLTGRSGRSGNSGNAAREAVETHFSDRLLLQERIESVRRQFG
jgi:hypothetical protein